MTRRTGSADLPLHGGRVPPWLAMRMSRLGAVMCQAIVHEYGRDELLRRLAHPFWFQSFGAVMGMDWHSSGITTSVIGALKRGLAPLSRELGVHMCGGRGKHSRATPGELLRIGERTGFDGDTLVRASKLVAKVDSAAVQDGFDLYLHGFIVTDDGHWAVVQQGMNGDAKQARRYHWLSEGLRDFVDDPHAAIEGAGQGRIVNLADRRAAKSRAAQVELLNNLNPDAIAREFAKLRGSPTSSLPGDAPSPACGGRPGWGRSSRIAPPPNRPGPAQRAGRSDDRREHAAQAGRPHPPQAGEGSRHCAVQEDRQLSLLPTLELSATQQSHRPTAILPHLQLPDHHDVRETDIVMRRLRGNLAAAAEAGPRDFTQLLQVPGVGARTVRALALVAEVLHGAPCRFTDPARFSIAHGGKDRHPFPVPTKVMDHTIGVLKSAVRNAKLGRDEELAALRRLDAQSRALEATARGPSFDTLIANELQNSHAYGGRSVFGWEPPLPAGEIGRSA